MTLHWSGSALRGSVNAKSRTDPSACAIRVRFLSASPRFNLSLISFPVLSAPPRFNLALISFSLLSGSPRFNLSLLLFSLLSASPRFELFLNFLAVQGVPDDD